MAISLSDFTSRRDLPRAHHFFVLNQEHLVVHIHAGADVIGDYGNDFAHTKAMGGT